MKTKCKSSIPSNSYWEIEFNLVEDLKELLYWTLSSYGYKNIDRDNSVLQYCDIVNKCVKAIPRKVKYSKQFRCPKGYKKDLKHFENLIVLGKDLSPHLTHRLINADEKDRLLYDWGIKHFHLTSEYNSNGTAMRSDYLVFAIVTEDTFYFIQIYKHIESFVFSKQEMIKIVNSNWPELLDKVRLKDASIEQRITDREYSVLRKANINTLVEINDNEIIAPLGGGYSLDGTSTKAFLQSNNLIKICSDLQSILAKHAEVIVKGINECNNSNIQYMIIKLIAISESMCFTLLEVNSNTVIVFKYKSGRIVFNKLDEYFRLVVSKKLPFDSND